MSDATTAGGSRRQMRSSGSPTTYSPHSRHSMPRDAARGAGDTAPIRTVHSDETNAGYVARSIERRRPREPRVVAGAVFFTLFGLTLATDYVRRRRSQAS